MNYVPVVVEKNIRNAVEISSGLKLLSVGGVLEVLHECICFYIYS